MWTPVPVPWTSPQGSKAGVGAAGPPTGDLRAANQAALPAKSQPRVVNEPAGVHHGGKEQQVPMEPVGGQKGHTPCETSNP